MSDLRKVVIIGGGFGGLSAAKQLKSDSVDVTLIDRRNYHFFQPLLYQVATGSLSTGEVAYPLRGVLHRNSTANKAHAWKMLIGPFVALDSTLWFPSIFFRTCGKNGYSSPASTTCLLLPPELSSDFPAPHLRSRARKEGERRELT